MICVPLRSKNFASILKNLSSAQRVGDVIELWPNQFGLIKNEELSKFSKIIKKPILLKFEGSLENLKPFYSMRIDYLDLDIATPVSTAKRIRNIFPGAKMILSYHNFNGCPDEKKLKALVSKMFSRGADIAKVAVSPKGLQESLMLLSLANDFFNQGRKVIFIGMGKHGEITRTAGHLCGNYLMYCPLSKSEATAPGQITARELRKIMDLTK